jgi:hypothetical protein
MTTRTTKRSDATKTSAQNKQQLAEENQRQWMDFAQESFIGTRFDPNIAQRGITYGRLDKHEIARLLRSPYVNFKQLQNYSRLFMATEGIYYRTIKTLANMLTYDHMLVPYAENSALIKYKKKLKECYDTASIYLEKMNLKANLPIFAEDLLIDGECYYYKVEDATGIIYQKIDNEYCLPYKNENGVWRFVIDCLKLNTLLDITTYPIEIQKAVALFNDKGSTNPMFIMERYYPVKNGICFSVVKEGKHGTPPFAFLFKDLIALEQKKELKEKIDRVNSTKMIHNKIETKDKDTMVDPKVARTYNEAIKKNLIQKNLDEGIFTITNPFEASILNLDTTSARTENMVANSITDVYNEFGVSQMLYNSEKGGAESIKKSLINDASYVINLLLKSFNCYADEELRLLNTKIRMKCVILDNTYFNNDDRKSTSLSDMAYGGSRLLYLANCGFSPLQGMNLLQSEAILDIDKLFVPAESSHTQSNTPNNKSGRKSAEDMQKSGQEVSEITQQVNEGK